MLKVKPIYVWLVESRVDSTLVYAFVFVFVLTGGESLESLFALTKTIESLTSTMML